jgi:hypothetical protein
MARLNFQETMDRLWLWVRAGYPIIWLNTSEEARAFECVARVVKRVNQAGDVKRLWRWSAGEGLCRVTSLAGNDEAPRQPYPWLEMRGLSGTMRLEQALPETKDNPMEALSQLCRADNAGRPDLANSVTVFFDVHPFLLETSGPLVRPVRTAAEELRAYYEAHSQGMPPVYKTIIIVAPSDTQRASELGGDIVTLDFPLPEREELQRVLEQRSDLNIDLEEPREGILSQGELSNDAAYATRLKELIASAGCGLPLWAYQQGLNLIRVTDGKLRQQHIDWMQQLKAETINNQALEYTPKVNVRLGGLAGITKWVEKRRDAATSAAVRAKHNLPAPKGVVLCGAAGAGKSQLAKHIATAFNLALLRLDVGALFGSYVGESERRTDEALRLAEVLSPVVLWIDEIDKGFGGAGGGGAAGGAGDGGVGARVFGKFLTWLGEKQSDVFVVVTANDLNRILVPFPEFGRKGRFDEIFWVDIPSKEGRREIFEIYLGRHFDSGAVEPGNVPAICSANQVALASMNREPRELLLDVLCDSVVSANMTGAEIEAAVAEAFYEAYERDRGLLRGDTLVEVVKRAQRRALYNNDGGLNGLRVAAQQQGWLTAS